MVRDRSWRTYGKLVAKEAKFFEPFDIRNHVVETAVQIGDGCEDTDMSRRWLRDFGSRSFRGMLRAAAGAASFGSSHGCLL